MQLIVVRHALPERVQTDGAAADPPLTELGHRQADAVANYLAGEPIDALYSSPMRRALQTAAPIAARTGLTPIVADGVAEFDRHSAEYIPLEQLKRDDPERFATMIAGGYFDANAVDPGQFQRRVVDAFDEIVAAHPGQRVAVTCHGGVINMLLASVLGLGPSMFFFATYTGITRIEASRAGHRSLVSVNETAHLRGV